MPRRFLCDLLLSSERRRPNSRSVSSPRARTHAYPFIIYMSIVYTVHGVCVYTVRVSGRGRIRSDLGNRSLSGHASIHRDNARGSIVGKHDGHAEHSRSPRVRVHAHAAVPKRIIRENVFAVRTHSPLCRMRRFPSSPPRRPVTTCVLARQQAGAAYPRITFSHFRVRAAKTFRRRRKSASEIEKKKKSNHIKSN